jgi:RNase adaptor protein for sRNA GlmZ degradation
MTAANPAPVRVVSFGYGHGDAPDAHLTLDLRHHFRDPHVRPEMRELTAVHRAVRRAVLRTPGIKALLAATVRAVQAFDAGPSATDTVVSVGCVGGRHRSAVAAEAIARRLRRRGHHVTVEHRDLHRPVIAR